MCRHYWLLEGQVGSVSNGVCKSCGVTKDFHNSFSIDEEKILQSKITPTKVPLRSAENNIDSFLEAIRHGKHPSRDFRYVEEIY
jgi:hypothetical protein